MTTLLVALILIQAAGAQARPQTGGSSSERADLSVRDTAGIRRFNYPVHARVPFKPGALVNAERVRLLRDDGTEVPAQMSAESRWADGSVRWLSVHFNTSLGPRAEQRYQVEYGPGVTRGAELGRGLSVVEDTNSVQVGSLRFQKSGNPLLTSVRYRDEAIGQGTNGFTAAGRGGETYRLLDSPDLEILKGGPLYVELRYSGELRSDTGGRVPFEMTVGMPNSKSWVKMTALVDDPAARVRELSLNLPFSLGAYPWVWDFGTERWTYGALRTENDVVTIESVVTAEDVSRSSSSWDVTLRRDGRDQLYETGDGVVGGWGHLQGAGEVVAFGVEGFGGEPGTYRVTVAGTGQTTFGFTPSRPTRVHRLGVYNHYVGTPVQIGAATSPSSMLSPLVAVCDLDRYLDAGLEPPPQARP